MIADEKPRKSKHMGVADTGNLIGIEFVFFFFFHIVAEI